MAKDETKNIDELIAARSLKNAELREIGIRIASASTPVVVAFVDLAESTRMKQEFEPEEWLGFVFEFIRCVDEMARVADGTVVKRIGDELMLTFNDVQASARFVDSLVSAATSKYIVQACSRLRKRISFPLRGEPTGRSVWFCGRPLCADRDVRCRRHCYLHS
jgi:class 3 adenylate cyclase